MFKSKAKKGLTLIVSLVILLALGVLVGCSNTITENDFPTHSSQANCICEDCETGTEHNELKITGSLITQDDLNLFLKLLELSQNNELNSSFGIQEMISERLNISTSGNSRGVDNYSLALGFVFDNWHLVENGQRSEETLLLIAGLIFDEIWTLAEATDIANSDHEIIWLCNSLDDYTRVDIKTHPAEPDKTFVCTCTPEFRCPRHPAK